MKFKLQAASDNVKKYINKSPWINERTTINKYQDYFIVINSLEELQQLEQETGKSIVIAFRASRITIYDDYME